MWDVNQTPAQETYPQAAGAGTFQKVCSVPREPNSELSLSTRRLKNNLARKLLCGTGLRSIPRTQAGVQDQSEGALLEGPGVTLSAPTQQEATGSPDAQVH